VKENDSICIIMAKQRIKRQRRNGRIAAAKINSSAAKMAAAAAGVAGKQRRRGANNGGNGISIISGSVYRNISDGNQRENEKRQRNVGGTRGNNGVKWRNGSMAWREKPSGSGGAWAAAKSQRGEKRRSGTAAKIENGNQAIIEAGNGEENRKA
jgi:hypothetical protein